MRLRLQWPRLIAVLFLIILQLPRSQATPVFAADPDAQAIAAHLESFTSVLGTLGGLDKFAQNLPLSSFDPTGAQGLRFASVFNSLQQSINTISTTLNTVSDLPAALSGLSGAYGGVQLTIGGPGGQPTITSSGSPAVYDIQLALHATRTVSIPLNFAQGPLSMQGGAMAATLSLDTSLHFQYNKAITNPHDAFYLVTTPSAPAITLTVTGDANIPSFAANFGFTEVDADGHAHLNAIAKGTLQDPNADGKITESEWSSASLTTLFATSFVTPDSGDAADITLNLSVPPSVVSTVPLTAGITLRAASLAAVPSPSVTIGDGLKSFANMSADKALVGVAQFAAAILTAASAHNFRLPLTDNTLAQASHLADKLQTFLAQQTDALIICGPDDTTSVTRTVGVLTSGSDVYCNAVTSQVPVSVAWTIANGTAVANDAVTQTVGASPSQNVHFVMNADGRPDVTLSFALGDGSVHTVVPRITTIEDLKSKLQSLLGAPISNINYDPATKAITYGLTFNETPGVYTGTLDIGDQLSAGSGLVGLTPGSGASLAIDPNFHFDVAFGVLLGSGVADGDRFFLQAPNGHVVTADAKITGTLDLNGNIGFVGVHAGGDPSAGDHTTAFSIGPSDTTKPMLTVDLSAPSGVVVSTTTGITDIAIPNAVGIDDMLHNITTTVVPACNMKLQAGLAVSATIGSAPPVQLGSGSVGVNWDPVFAPSGVLGACTPDTSNLHITPSDSFSNTLGGFNLDPKNPAALLELVLDNLNNIADAIQNLPGLDQQIPGLNVKPSDLVRQAAKLRDKVNVLRTGGGAAPGVIHCDTQTPHGDGSLHYNDTTSAAHAQQGDVVYCAAQVPPLDPSQQISSPVTWTVTGATTDPTSHATDPATVGTTGMTTTTGSAPADTTTTLPVTPTTAFSFTVTDPNGNYHVALHYAIAAGSVITPAGSADYPAITPPSSLQDLSKKLTDLLGLPASALQLQLKDVMGTPKPDLVIRLKYGVCSQSHDQIDASNTLDCTDLVKLPNLQTTFNFNLGGNSPVASLVGVKGSGGVGLQYGAIAQFNTAVNLYGFIAHPSTPTQDLAILNTSGLTATAAVTTPGGMPEFTATAGPFQLTAGHGGVFKAGFSLGVADTVNASTEGPATLTDFGFKWTGLPVDCGTVNDAPTNVNGACADVPLSLNGSSLGDVGFTANVAPGSSPAISATVPASLTSKLASAVLNVNTFFDGLNYVLDLLKGSLNGGSYQGQAHVPFVGDDLSGGAKIIDQFQTGVVSPTQKLVNEVTSNSNPITVTNCVKGFLYAALGPNASGGNTVQGCPPDAPSLTLHGAGLLLHSDGTNNATPDDVTVIPMCGTATCDSNSNLYDMTNLQVHVSLAVCRREHVLPRDSVLGDHFEAKKRASDALLPSHNAKNKSNVLLSDRLLGQQGQASTPKFDLGLPGVVNLKSDEGALQATAGWQVNLKSDEGALQATAGWQVNLTFGISKTVGFYIAPDDPNKGSDLAVVSSSVSMPGDKAITADLAVLEAAITNTQPGTPLAGVHIGLGISDTISMAALAQGVNPLKDLHPDIGVDANLNLGLKTQLRAGETAGLPSLTANFVMTWTYQIESLNGGLPSPATPNIYFNNVTFHAGEFVSRFLAPTARQIQTFTKPLQPVIDTVEAPVPGISTLSTATGGDPVTMLSILEKLGGCDCSAIDRIVGVVQFVNGIDTTGNGDLPILIGSFQVAGAATLAAPPTPGQDHSSAVQITDDQSSGVGNSLSNFLGGNGQLKGAAASDLSGSSGGLTGSSFSAKTGLSFPFLQHPTQMFNLLLGQDIDMVRYDSGPLVASAGFEYNFPPIFIGPVPLAIGVFGHISLSARLAVAYDTSGIRKVLSDHTSGEHLLDGIYLPTVDESGKPIHTVELDGQIGASASVSAVIFSVGVKAGIELDIFLNLHDPDGDGKVRIDELYSELHNPVCLFDLGGRLSFFLEAYASVDLFLWSQEWDFPIVNITLLDFNQLGQQLRTAICASPNPVWAEDSTSISSDSNAPPNYIDASGNTHTFDPAHQHWLVVNVGPFAGLRNFQTDQTDETVKVRQIKEPIVDAGALITKTGFEVEMLGQVQKFFGDYQGVYVDGGSGNDKISFEAGHDYSVTPNASLAFSAPVVALGGDGNNLIMGGQGPNTIYGATPDAGFACSDPTTCSNQIQGGPLADLLYGGPGNDVINGGGGGDTIDGRAGNDTIAAGDGNSTVYGGDGSDIISTGAGNSVVYGDKSGETACATGATCDDSISMGAGQSVAIGGPGANTLDAQGCAQDATSCTTSSILIGGSEGNLHLSDIQDWFTHAGDAPYAYNVPGVDTLCASDGFPGDGNNRVQGGPGNDLIIGGQGHDVLLGEGGNDRICGRGGNDALIGGQGNDYLDSGAGNNVLIGDDGAISDTGTLQSVLLPATLGSADQAVLAQVQLAPSQTDGADKMVGGGGNDFLFGEGGADIMDGGPSADYMVGGDGNDVMHGGGGNDVMFGDNANGSCASAPNCDDIMYGDAGNDEMHGGLGANYMVGGDGSDKMYGDGGGYPGQTTTNTMYGDSDVEDGACASAACNDVMYGGVGQAYMEGGPGSDIMDGAALASDMIGGSAKAGLPDGGGSLTVGTVAVITGNLMYGGPGADVMCGANCAISRVLAGLGTDPNTHGPTLGSVQIFDTPMTPNCAASVTTAGSNYLDGGVGADIMYGAALADTMLGGPGNDHMEGGPGADTLYGDSGQNDLVGGYGRLDTSNPASAADGMCDGNDTIYGGDGSLAGSANADQYGLASPSRDSGSGNVIAGDNADIQRPTDPLTGLWLTNHFDQSVATPAVSRTVTLLDVATTTNQAPLTNGTSGNDTLWGDYGDDQLYGQGGNDTMHGGPGDDYMEGNAGSDIMYGDGGNDDLIGGSAAAGQIDANIPTSVPPTVSGNGMLLGNLMYGGDGADVMVGNNGTITRPIVASAWQTIAKDGTPVRVVTQLDIAPAPNCPTTTPTTAGDDYMDGGAGNDVLLGEAGADSLHGGPGDDHLEGGSGNDILYGDSGQDDLIGGTGRATEVISGSLLTTGADPRSIPVADGLCDGNDTLYGGDGSTTTLNTNAPTNSISPIIIGAPDSYAGDGSANTANDADTLIGDNGTIDRPTSGSDWVAAPSDGTTTPVSRTVHLVDVATTGFTPAAGTSGDDILWGEYGSDQMYGQGGADHLYGGPGDDHLEGGSGNDVLYGDSGQDDLIGGTGRTVSMDASTAHNGYLDGSDTIYGGDGSTTSITAATLNAGNGQSVAVGPGVPDVYGLSATPDSDPSETDVVAGDNGTIDRPLDGQGHWITNAFSASDGSISRTVRLYDVATISYTAPLTNGTSGNDTLWGETGNDLMYGQGRADTMFGGLGDDHMEGNAGNDVMFGGGGQDDMLGGTGRINDDPATGTPNRIDGANIMFGDDDPLGGTGSTDGHDVMIGNNGLISRPLTASGAWTVTSYATFTYSDAITTNTSMSPTATTPTSRVQRVVQMVDTQPMSVTLPGGAVYANGGSDIMHGNGGDDDMIGGFDSATEGIATQLANVPDCAARGLITLTGDLMCGDAGDDAMLGDQGVITDTVETGSRTGTISIPAPFIQETNYPKGQLTRQVQLTQPSIGGDDVMQGGSGNDWMHGGAGNDLMNGDSGNDRLFGDDGGDALWGGPGHDHLYGGYGDDFQDVQFITSTTSITGPNPAAWSIVAPVADTLQGIDYSYGGWGRDLLQADFGGPGPQLGDRLIDWVGNYNLYYTCPGAYGEGVITRQYSPAMQQYLIDQATGDGAIDVATAGTSGFDELGLVYVSDIKQNNGPPYPGSPGHFTCAA